MSRDKTEQEYQELLNLYEKAFIEILITIEAIKNNNIYKDRIRCVINNARNNNSFLLDGFFNHKK